MKLVVQKVKKASVTSEGTVTGQINKGYMVLVGIKTTDTKVEADYLARKLINLRIFEDENEKMNLSIKDVGGELLLVSQFTLYGDATQGNRPSFIEAARPEQANELYEYFCNQCAKEIHMEVSLVNDGPVTIILEK